MRKETKRSSYKWLTLLIVSIGSFMGTLDGSIVYISFPTLSSTFETEPSVILWVTVAYLLVSTSLMPIVGKIGDTLGRKKFYILGFALFTIGLILCSLSQNIAHLILSRVVQGVGASMTVTLGFAIVTAAFPDQERGKALGINGAVLSVGLLSGPALGGLLLDTWSWQAIFYTRVPVSIIGLVMAWRFLKEQRGSVDASLKFDLRGAAVLFAGLTCLLLFLNLGGRLGFASASVIVLGTSALVLSVLFVILEGRAEQPLVDLILFKNRSFAGGNISICILVLAIASQSLLMPFYLIDGVGYSASKAGLLLATVPLTIIIIGPLSGWSSDKVDARILCTIGIALICLALFLLSRLSSESSAQNILLRLIVFGIGMGMFLPPNTSSIMGSVPKDRLSTASAMVHTARQIGLSSGLAIAGMIFTTRKSFHTAQLAHSIPDALTLDKLSVVSSYQDTLFIAALICIIGIFTSVARGRKRRISRVSNVW